jgi:uncharacterized protein (DUF1810 family)
MTHRNDLQRFLDAQRGVCDRALSEIRAGAKRSHWIWFIFPQIAGLSGSAMSQLYAISSLEEARNYWAHPILGARLRDCMTALAQAPDPDPEAVFGAIDAGKLHSSLTLFEVASGAAIFSEALNRWYGGKRDSATLRLLN